MGTTPSDTSPVYIHEDPLTEHYHATWMCTVTPHLTFGPYAGHNCTTRTL